MGALFLTPISFANTLFGADFFCKIAQQSGGKCIELPTDEQSLINILSNLLLTTLETVTNSLPPICATDEKLENGICVKIPSSPICKTDEKLENGICVKIPSSPICKTDEKLENNVCVKIPSSPICKTDEKLENNVCVKIAPIPEMRIQLCEEKNLGVSFFEQKLSRSCFDNIVIRNGKFSNENVVSKDDPIELSIQILPEAAHIGMKADILLFVFRYDVHNLVEEWFARIKQNWSTWSLKDWKGMPFDLPFDSQQVVLGYAGEKMVYSTFVPIFQGELRDFEGSNFMIFTGYRLEDGTLICNCQNPLVISVKNSR